MSVLDLINQKKEEKRTNKIILPITTLKANKSQLSVIKEVEKSTLVSVLGGAGVGKSQTIVNIASHFLATNRSVLIVASSDEAVNVVADRLNGLCGMDICMRGGRKESNTKLASKLLDLVEGKINLEDTEKMNIIKYLFNHNEETAKKLLKSKTIKRLNELVNNKENRKNLIIQAKMNLQTKLVKKQKLMSEIDFTPILKAFSAWAVTPAQISEVLPLKKDMFDVCVIDEGSMGNIAEYLPILHRCKKCVCVGDPNQIKYISWLENKKEISFAKKHEISEDLQLVWKYRTNSIWDFLNYYADKTILLDEYYRGYKEIFEFSNRKFYGNKIKIMTESKKDSVQKIKIDGKLENGVNKAEADKVIELVKSIIKQEENKTIGILSPIRKQCDYITKRLQEEINYNDIVKHQIQCTTAHGYQGAERDIMINSWFYAKNSPYQTLTFISSPNLLNVAVTRARQQVINLYSNENMKDSLVGEYLASIK